MTTTSENRKETLRDLPHNWLPAAFIGFLLGEIAIQKSETIARAVLNLAGDSCCDIVKTANLSLTIIGIFFFLHISVGAFCGRKGWIRYKDIMLSLLVSLTFAFFIILDYGLPGSNGPCLPFKEKFYYVVWALVLMVVPFIILLPWRALIPLIPRGITLSAMSAAMALICGSMGFLVQEMMKLANVLPDKWVVWPSMLNAILGAYLVVAFVDVWWREFLNWRSFARWSWMIGYVAFSFLYLGWFGFRFYAENEVDQWKSFFVFGAFPLVACASVIPMYTLANSDSNRWPACSILGWLLPVILAFGFGIIAWFGLPKISHSASVEWTLMVAHGANGLLLGLSILCFQPVLKYLFVRPEEKN